MHHGLCAHLSNVYVMSEAWQRIQHFPQSRHCTSVSETSLALYVCERVSVYMHIDNALRTTYLTFKCGSRELKDILGQKA